MLSLLKCEHLLQLIKFLILKCVCVLCVEFLIVPHTRVTQQVRVVLVEAIAQSSAAAVLATVSHRQQCCYETVY